MIKYMGIYKGAYFEKAANYTHTQWREKLKAELSKHPIVYSGRTVAFPDAPSGYGHSFVFDGYGKYAGEDVFHVNFGWSGNCSGYYYETSLDPYGRSDYNFSYECGATFNFYPDPSSEATFKMTLADEGFEYDADPPTKAGDLLQFSMAFLKNDGPEAYYGAAKLVAEHKDGTPIKVLYTEDYSDDPITPNGGAVWFNVDEPIDFDVTFGDRVVCYYSIGTEWIRLEAFPKNGAILDELPLMPVAFIQTADSYKVNDWFEFAVMNIARRYDDAVWTITRPDGTVVGDMYMSDRDFKLTQAGVYKIEVSLPYNYDGNEVIVTYIEVN